MNDPDKYQETQTAQIAVVMNEIKNIKDILAEIKQELKDGSLKFAPIDRFNRLENIVFGGIGFIVLGVIGAILALVLR